MNFCTFKNLCIFGVFVGFFFLRLEPYIIKYQVCTQNLDGNEGIHITQYMLREGEVIHFIYLPKLYVGVISMLIPQYIWVFHKWTLNDSWH